MTWLRDKESPQGQTCWLWGRMVLWRMTQNKFIPSFNKHMTHTQIKMSCSALPGNLQTAQGTNHDSAAQSDTQSKHLKEETAASNTGVWKPPEQVQHRWTNFPHLLYHCFFHPLVYCLIANFRKPPLERTAHEIAILLLALGTWLTNVKCRKTCLGY